MRPFYAIVKATLQSLLRERILYNVIFVAIFLLAIGYLAALLVYGHQDRVMLDFGIMINSLSVFFIAASAGARMVKQEIDQRTLYPTLVKPISRVTYYFAKWLGIALFLGLNLILLTLVLMGGLHLTGGAIHGVLFQALSLTWVESMMIAAAALLSSLFFTSSLTVMCTLAFLFIAHNREQIQFLNEHGQATLLGRIQFIFPKAQYFLLDTRVYYDLGLSTAEWIQRAGYGAIWILFFLLIGNAVFYRKNL